MEIWKVIPGYETIYEISDRVRVRNKITGNILTPFERRGYSCVLLSKNGKAKHQRLHRLFALAFIPNPESKPWVTPLDGNYFNISIENLVWATPVECHRIAKNFVTWKEVLSTIKQTNNIHISLKNLVAEYYITPTPQARVQQ